MRIRKATVADAAAIAAVHVRSWQAAYRGLLPREFLDGLDTARRQEGWARGLAADEWPRAGVLVAEQDDQVRGFVGVGPARDAGADPAHVAELAAIYLLPEAWGQGMGRLLMARAVEAMTSAGYQRASLWVLDTNARARRFYEAAGWHADGASKTDSSWGVPLSEVRYQISLTGSAPAPEEAGS